MRLTKRWNEAVRDIWFSYGKRALCWEDLIPTDQERLKAITGDHEQMPTTLERETSDMTSEWLHQRNIW